MLHSNVQALEPSGPVEEELLFFFTISMHFFGSNPGSPGWAI